MNDLEVIVVAPTGRDAPLICELLTRVGIHCSAFPDCHEACHRAADGVGVFVIADEVLTDGSAACVAALVRTQPSWSDLPIVVLTDGGKATRLSEERQKLRAPMGNVIL